MIAPGDQHVTTAKGYKPPNSGSGGHTYRVGTVAALKEARVGRMLALLSMAVASRDAALRNWA